MAPPVAYKPINQPPADSPGRVFNPKFFPTFYEWLSQNSQQIVGDKIVEDGRAVVYKVPADHVFFLNSVSLHLHNNTVGDIDGNLQLNKQNLLVGTPSGTGAGAHVERFSLSYPIPLRIQSTDELEVVSGGANAFSWATFTGFLVRLKDLPVI